MQREGNSSRDPCKFLLLSSFLVHISERHSLASAIAASFKCLIYSCFIMLWWNKYRMFGRLSCHSLSLIEGFPEVPVFPASPVMWYLRYSVCLFGPLSLKLR